MIKLIDEQDMSSLGGKEVDVSKTIEDLTVSHILSVVTKPINQSEDFKETTTTAPPNPSSGL